MDTTEIIMISKIYHHQHLESSPQGQLLYFNCKSNEVSGNYPCEVPVNVITPPQRNRTVPQHTCMASRGT